MATAHEEDVVIAFRQAVEEEMRRVQRGAPMHDEIYIEGASPEENLRRLATQHAELQHEVALLRTIVLRLVSEPIDEEGNPL